MANTKITVANMAANSIDSDQYVDGSIDTAHIADGQITVGKMAANSVDSAQYVDGSIDTAHYADNSITGAELADNIVIAGTLGSTGKITADAGIDIDNFNIDGTTIALSSGDLTLDVAGDMIIDVDGGDIYLNDGGTGRGQISMANTDLTIISATSDRDLIFKGVDGASVITALTLDMSDAGAATFNAGATFGADLDIASTGNGLQVGRSGYDTYALQHSAGNGMAIYNVTDSRSEMFFDGGGNVGIGTDSPSSKLHLATTGTEEIGIGLQNSQRYYGIQTTGGNLTIKDVSAGGTTRMTLDSSGNLLVGTTTAPNTLLGASSTQGLGFSGSQGYLVAAASGQTTAYFNRQTSDGTIADFRKDGTTVGSIGNISSRIYIGSGDTGIFFDSIRNQVQPCNTSTGSGIDATIDLGRDVFRFKDLYLSGGAYIGGTGAANKLDDYEEGTWTATTTGGGTFTIGTNSCLYTKIGRQVTAKFNITFSAASGNTAFITIGGLPFGVANISANYGANPALVDNLASATGVNLVQTGINSTSMIFLTSTGGTAGHNGLAGNQITTNTTLRGTVVYFTA